jgi:hypothetical protein
VTPIFDEIRATDLVEWASRAESERWMPSLLRQLILGSGAQLRQCRLLTYEQTNLGGCDGFVEAEAAGLHVPLGRSGWELSRKKGDVVEKAREDAEKRTRQPCELIPPEDTLVVVTLQVWPRHRRADGSFAELHEHKAAWAREQAATLGWRGIVVLDAVDLAGWIAQQPAVGVWLSRVMGRRVDGARSLLLHWSDLATLDPSIRPPVFLAGRREFRDQLTAWFSEPAASTFEVRSWSHEDVRDAVAAWWMEQTDAGSLPAGAAVAVASVEAWLSLCHAPAPLLLLADEGLDLTSEQVSSATSRGHRVIVRTEAGLTRGVGCRLPLLHRDSLAEALRSGGMDNDKAWRIAGEVAGSGVAMKRLLAGRGPQPEWTQPAVAAQIAPIVLFGAWEGDCEEDQARIAEVFARSYAEVEAALRPWSETNDPLLRRDGQRWRVISREEAWRWLSLYLRTEQYRLFRRAAVSVLAELNPRYDLPVEQRIYAAIHGQEPRHSHRLRRAMAETLCLLSLRSPDTDEGRRAIGLARGIVTEIFAQADDWRLWASLDHALVFLAEAEPDLFLKAVEDDLLRPAPATIELFRQGREGVFGEWPHVEMMWALEGLMWERAWVKRAASVLARMAARDPGGNCSPRPAGVLREAFLPWFPQCCLDVEDRCRVLDQLMQTEPEFAWNLFVGLLPKTHDVSTPRHRPTYRKVVAVGDQGVTRREYRQQVSHVARRLVEAAGADHQRWAKLVEELDSFPDDVFDVALVQIESLGASLDEEKRMWPWEALRRAATDHRFFAAADWAMPTEKVAKLEAVAAGLQPTDLVAQVAWIFDSWDAYPPGITSETPAEERREAQTAAKIDALRLVATSGGLVAIRSLVMRIGEDRTGSMGFLVAKDGVIHADTEILPAWLEDESPRVVAFARGYASARFNDGGWDWLHAIGVGHWRPETFARLAGIFPLREQTWQQIDTLGAAFSDAFWRATGTWMHGASPSETERVILELIAHQRPFAALECADSCLHGRVEMPPDCLLAVLEAVRTELGVTTPADSQAGARPKLDPHHVGEILCALQKSEALSVEQAQRVEGFEWFFLPILRHYGSLRLLLRRLRREPEFFVEAITLGGYRRDESVPPESSEPTDHERNVAKLCCQLLDAVRILPGTDDAGHLDEQTFRRWVKEARALAAAKGYTRACEYLLGKWLLHSPVGENGCWPCAAVCRLMTDKGTDKMKESFEVAIFNNQGWPGPLRNELEMSSRSARHESMLKLRALADRHDLEFPIVAVILRNAANAQERSLEEHFRDDD